MSRLNKHFNLRVCWSNLPIFMAFCSFEATGSLSPLQKCLFKHRYLKLLTRHLSGVLSACGEKLFSSIKKSSLNCHWSILVRNRSNLTELVTCVLYDSNFRGRYGETADRQEDHQDTYGYYSHHYQSNQYPQNQANPYYPTDAWGGHQSYQQPNYQAHYPQQYDYSNQTQETLPSTQQVEKEFNFNYK